jgi:hypothetical protein
LTLHPVPPVRPWPEILCECDIISQYIDDYA